jgi:hypothetical protein
MNEPFDFLFAQAVEPIKELGRILGGLGSQRPDCVAGVVGLELRNVGANYPFEKSRRFPAIQPNLVPETVRV